MALISSSDSRISKKRSGPNARERSAAKRPRNSWTGPLVSRSSVSWDACFAPPLQPIERPNTKRPTHPANVNSGQPSSYCSGIDARKRPTQRNMPIPLDEIHSARSDNRLLDRELAILWSALGRFDAVVDNASDGRTSKSVSCVPCTHLASRPLRKRNHGPGSGLNRTSSTCCSTFHRGPYCPISLLAAVVFGTSRTIDEIVGDNQPPRYLKERGHRRGTGPSPEERGHRRVSPDLDINHSN